MLLVVLSQPLRQKEAAIFLRGRQDARKVVITRFAEALDKSAFEPDTTIRSWSSGAKSRPSARVVTGLSRLKRWLRSGSSVGLRIDKWARAADWRLRHVDRLFVALESGRDAWNLHNPALIEVLERETREETESEIAVFDLFDLPAVLSFSETRDCVVTVR